MSLNNYISATVIIGVIIILYALYYVIAYTKITTWIYRTFFKKMNETVFHAVFFRLLGFLFFGIITAFIFNVVFDAKFDFITIQISQLEEMLPWILFLFLLAVIVPYINVKNSKQNPYPQFKIDNWTNQYKFLSYLTWILYLTGYEFMFRGILLFGTLEELGYYPAIILNVVLYAVVHIPKGKKEVLGCFILGPILCFSAIETNTIIVPVILHISVCLSNEYFSIRTETVNQRKLN